jgi:prophage maintenance system killer protein
LLSCARLPRSAFPLRLEALDHECAVAGRSLEKGMGEMEQAVGLLARTLKGHALVTDEGRAVLDVVEHYARSWRLLLEYDERRLAEAPVHPLKPTGTLALESARGAIGSLRLAVAAAGQRRADIRRGAPYPSVQARAAHLLYFLIKDHPFSDGNKRIGTLLFLEYLRRNGMLVRADGAFRLADNAMVALALLVAESEPKQKDLMIRLVLSLLEDGQ